MPETGNNNWVSVVRLDKPIYPRNPPYHPSEPYPEYPFAGHISSAPNYAYDGIRRLFLQLKLDEERFGTKAWNPLGDIVRPGMRVLLKPNFVLSRHKDDKDLYAIITHPSVLRAVADYCWIALGGQGQITIADAPQYDCNFSELLEATRLREVIGFYSNFPGPQAHILDLRNYWSPWKHFTSLLQPLPGDPEGDLAVNLGVESALYGKEHPEKLYGAVYNRNETIAGHTGCNHQYQVSSTVMNADVVFSIPKLKVHKKVGVTLNAKGLVGITTNKNLLVHYTLTSPKHGGDQYPDGLFTPFEEMLIRTERWMYDHFLASRRISLEYLHRAVYWMHNNSTRRMGFKVREEKRMLDAGNWHGNDSAWRMAADLTKIFYFVDRKGVLHDQPQRSMFSIIDGVIGGENNGPLSPDPKPAGVLIAGRNLIAVDVVASRLMGFDPLKMRLYQSLLAETKYNYGLHGLREISVVSSDDSLKHCLGEGGNPYLGFKPHPGWVGHIEAHDSIGEPM